MTTVTNFTSRLYDKWTDEYISIFLNTGVVEANEWLKRDVPSAHFKHLKVQIRKKMFEQGHLIKQ